MNEQRFTGEVQFNLHRHSEKEGVFPLKQGQDGEPGEKNILPVDGIQQSQAEGRVFAEQIRDIPRAVVYGFTSNVARTQEADYIFGEELRYMANKLPNSRVYSQKEKSLEEIAEEVDESIDKIVIINSSETTGLGMHKWNMERFSIIAKELGGELATLTAWATDPELQKELGVTPEEVAEDFKSWIRTEQARATKLFPGRPIVISGIGHSFELDTIFAALMGKEMNTETLREFGGEMIRTMEGAKVVLDKEGKGRIEYRNLCKDFDLSPDVNSIN